MLPQRLEHDVVDCPYPFGLGLILGLGLGLRGVERGLGLELLPAGTRAQTTAAGTLPGWLEQDLEAAQARALLQTDGAA